MKLLIILIFLFINLNSFSQQPVVTIGPAMKSSKMANDIRIVGSDELAHYILFEEKKGMFKMQYTLKKIGKNLAELKSLELPSEDDELKTELYFKELLFIDNRLLLFRHSYDKKTKQYTLYANALNKETFAKEGKLMNLGDFTRLNIEPSEDKKFVILNYIEPESLIKTLNSSLEVATSVPEPSKKYRVSKRELGINQVKVTNTATHAVAEYAVSLPGKKIISFDVANKSDTDIIVAGYYSNSTTAPQSEKVSGYFVQVLDPELKNIKSSQTIENQLQTDDKSGYTVVDVVLSETGDIIMIGEQVYVKMIISMQKSSVLDPKEYHYMDLIVTALSYTGDLKWNVKIPKAQISRDDFGIYSSCVVQYSDSKVHLMYNDAAENVDMTSGKVQGYDPGNKGSAVILATVSHDGKLTKKLLLDEGETSVKIRPAITARLSRNELMLFGEKMMGDQFIKVSF
jgi:hypothetical protein